MYVATYNTAHTYVPLFSKLVMSGGASDRAGGGGAGRCDAFAATDLLINAIGA